MDSNSAPSIVQVAIKASKTDPFRKGVKVYLGRTDNNLCPVATVVAYLAIRHKLGAGPFFKFQSGTALTWALLVNRVRKALKESGIDADKFSGHSFRIGAASTAAARGVEDSLIKTLGRWESSAYLLYVQVPRERLVDLSVVLAK